MNDAEKSMILTMVIVLVGISIGYYVDTLLGIEYASTVSRGAMNVHLFTRMLEGAIIFGLISKFAK